MILATLNAGGYRYGASDQAFYQPAVLEKIHPQLYPRDSGLIAVQARLTTYDELVAALVRVSGTSVPTAFALLYVVSLVLIALGTWMISRRLYATSWGAVALRGGGLPTRHRAIRHHARR